MRRAGTENTAPELSVVKSKSVTSSLALFPVTFSSSVGFRDSEVFSACTPYETHHAGGIPNHVIVERMSNQAS